MDSGKTAVAAGLAPPGRNWDCSKDSDKGAAEASAVRHIFAFPDNSRPPNNYRYNIPQHSRNERMNLIVRSEVREKILA